MIQIWERPNYPNRWEEPADLDPRAEGLVRLANLLCDVGEEPDPPLPLALAALLRETANRIELLTETDQTL